MSPSKSLFNNNSKEQGNERAISNMEEMSDGDNANIDSIVQQLQH